MFLKIISSDGYLDFIAFGAGSLSVHSGLHASAVMASLSA